MDNPNKDITLKDVAKAAGVSVATVSLVLRGVAGPSARTRARVSKVANDLGYVPDPALSALVARRSSTVSKRQSSMVAIVDNWDTESGWATLPAAKEMCRGVEREAESLGYGFIRYWADCRKLSKSRLSSILDSRGVRGVILAPYQAHNERLDLEWDRFSVVGIDNEAAYPVFPNITQDHYAMMERCIEEIYKKGYRRVGLVADTERLKRWHGKWAAALAVCGILEVSEPFFVNLESEVPPAEDGSLLDQLKNWLRQNRLEVIVGHDSSTLKCLSALGVKVPRDVSYVTLNVNDDCPDVSGLMQRRTAVGAAAMRTVHDLMILNRRGEFKDCPPPVTYINPVWIEGYSAPGASSS